MCQVNASVNCVDFFTFAEESYERETLGSETLDQEICVVSSNLS